MVDFFHRRFTAGEGVINLCLWKLGLGKVRRLVLAFGGNKGFVHLYGCFGSGIGGKLVIFFDLRDGV